MKASRLIEEVFLSIPSDERSMSLKKTLSPLDTDAKNNLAQCGKDDVRRKTFLESFQRLCGGQPDAMAQAGGRVNLIGEHVDYPDLQFQGSSPSRLMSMGGSIQNSFLAALKGRSDKLLQFYHLDAGEMFSINMGELVELEAKSVEEREQRVPMEERSAPEWAHHSLACVRELHRKRPIEHGLDILLTSNVPHGAGMSNSAANCVALTLCFKKAYALSDLSDPQAVVEFARTSERSAYVGGQCGYLDQMLIVHSKEGQLTALDYSGNLVSHFTSSLKQPWQFVAINTLVPHVLAESDYTIRVSELETGIRLIRKVLDKDVGSTYLSLKTYNLLLSELTQTAAIVLPLEDEGYDLPSDAISSTLESLLKNFQPLTIGDHPQLNAKDSLSILLKRMRHQKCSSLIVPEAGRLAQNGDGEGFGRLLDIEGQSLRMSGDFQITGSNGAQDALLDSGFEAGIKLNLTTHGRMLGGGGGGNVLFLVKRENEKQYREWIDLTRQLYRRWSAQAFSNEGIGASVIEPSIGAGAELID